MARRVFSMVCSRHDLAPSLNAGTRSASRPLPQRPSCGSWECGTRPVVAILHPGWGEGGCKGAGSPQGLFRRNYMGFIQKVGSALEEFRTRWAGFHFAWRARGKRSCLLQHPRAPPHPGTMLCPCLGRLSPAVEQGQKPGLVLYPPRALGSCPPPCV